ncbi:MAG: hypothetical protein L3K08_04180 [Thermoplasmata archaeon]|nr:hypothetical protein [Thermoplasmata archaeon]
MGGPRSRIGGGALIAVAFLLVLPSAAQSAPTHLSFRAPYTGSLTSQYTRSLSSCAGETDRAHWGLRPQFSPATGILQGRGAISGTSAPTSTCRGWVFLLADLVFLGANFTAPTSGTFTFSQHWTFTLHAQVHESVLPSDPCGRGCLVGVAQLTSMVTLVDLRTSATSTWSILEANASFWAHRATISLAGVHQASSGNVTLIGGDPYSFSLETTVWLEVGTDGYGSSVRAAIDLGTLPPTTRLDGLALR